MLSSARVESKVYDSQTVSTTDQEVLDWIEKKKLKQIGEKKKLEETYVKYLGAN